jgi:hypothetical protein
MCFVWSLLFLKETKGLSEIDQKNIYKPFVNPTDEPTVIIED